MKLLQITLLTAMSMSGAYAAVAPVADSSVYKPTKNATGQLTTRLNKLQVVVSNLQNKVDKLHTSSKPAVKAVAKKPVVKAVAKKPVVKAAAKKPVAKAVAKGSAANQRVVKKAKVVPASKGEKKTYRVAYLSLRAKKVDAAIAGFNTVIKSYPKGPLADNSQYWLGEALLLKGKKEKAMQAFDKVVANYPNSDKVPGALLKLGLVQLSLNNRPKAKEYLDYIIINYPKTRAAKIASKRAGKAKL